MAFKDGNGNIVISDESKILHDSFHVASSSTLSSTETKIKASDGATFDFFGGSVAVGSGRICVGAYGDDDNGSYTGSAYVFDLDGTQLAKITASDGATNDFFGDNVAVGSGRIVVGSPGDD